MIQGHGDDLYKYNKVEINFSTNIFNHFNHSALFAYLAERLPRITSYPEPEPLTLERALAKRLDVEPENVIATNGATEAIYLIAQCFKDGDAHILQPTFAEYADACRLHGCKVKTIASLGKDDGFKAGDTVWLCNPNNPTGKVTANEEVISVISANPEMVFIIDQSYSSYTTHKVLSAGEAVSLRNVLILNSMTKDFGIPGLRLGYVTGGRKLIDRLCSKRMPWSVNQIAIDAGLYLVDHSDDYRVDAAGLSLERERVAALISAMGIKTYPSDSNMLLCQLPRLSAAELKAHLVDEYGILIRDASNFEGLTERHFRIAVQTVGEDDKLIKALKKWME